MKKLTTLAVMTVVMVACTTQKQAEQGKTVAQQLMERLDTLRGKGYMFGHQDDPFYGLTWDYQPDSSDVKNVCGDWPAVMGFVDMVMGGEISPEAVMDKILASKRYATITAA